MLAFGPTPAEAPSTPKACSTCRPRGDLIEAAANLFSHLRALDAAGAGAIAVMPIPRDGLGEAINDRLGAPRRRGDLHRLRSNKPAVIYLM